MNNNTRHKMELGPGSGEKLPSRDRKMRKKETAQINHIGNEDELKLQIQKRL